MGGESQLLGKRGECAVIGKLMEMGCDVYQPLVDTKRIDCVIRSEKGEYKEIQVKTRTPSDEHGARVFAVHGFRERKNYFIICHFIGTSDYWVLPSRIFEKHAVANKRDFTHFTMTGKKQFELTRYHNNFDLLKK